MQDSYELFRALNFGKIGVVIFFFISGMIIPRSLLLNHSQTPVKSFIISRCFRLYPAYWTSAIIAASFASTLWTKQFLVNLTMLQQFVGVENLIGVYWTLQIELVFYVICAVLFHWGRLALASTATRMYLLAISAACIMAALRAVFHRSLPVAMPLGLAVMFLGTAFYWHSIQTKDMTTNKLKLLLVTFALLLIPICLLAYSNDTGFSERWYSYYCSYLTATTLFILLSTKFKISNKLLTYLGLISYSIYLLHPLCRIQFLTGNSNIAAATNMILSILNTICCASLSFYLIEKPWQMIGKKLRYLLIIRDTSEVREPLVVRT